MDWLPEEVPELPVQTFIDHLLPNICLDAKGLERICRKLKKRWIYDTNNHQRPILDELRSDSGQNEVTELHNLYRIESDIAMIGEEVLGSKSNAIFTSDKNQIPACDWTSFKGSRPDGGAALKKSLIPEWRRWDIFRVDKYGCESSDEELLYVSCYHS
jgi:hypothetical protein